MTVIAERAARTWLALVHHPVYDRAHNVITTTITNLDIHDIARSTRTYGLAGYLLVTPIAAQRELCERILARWQEDDVKDSDRASALGRAEVVVSVEECVALVTARAGAAPRVVSTSARDRPGQIAHAELARLDDRPLLLLFGTGWGLADSITDRVDHCLAPIRGASNYNHLSVRSAAAITLDRLFAESQ